jgi:hypothetical protein
VRQILRPAAILLVALALIYVPDMGHGFIRDDFMWLRTGIVDDLSDIRRIATGNVGFYRPAVSATFSIDYELFGLSSRAYAFTNLTLLLVTAVLVVRLGARLGMQPEFALCAAALWAFNFHGPNMAVLWISGRTALLLCLFALLATLAALRARWWLAALWCLLAMLSKEEAVVLPFVLVATACLQREAVHYADVAGVARRALPVFATLALYAWLRSTSGAFGPFTAPPYYQLTTSPALLARNIAEYADRAGSLAGAVALMALAVVRIRPPLSVAETRTLLSCGLWFSAGFALTVFVPVRSSLYVLFPSIGSALACAVMLQAWSRTDPRRLRRYLAAIMALPFLLLPVYRIRNQRWVEPAEMSHRLVADLSAMRGSAVEGCHVVAVDDPQAAMTLDNVFGGLFQDAVSLYVADRCVGEIRGSSPPYGVDDAVLLVRLRGGHLVMAGDQGAVAPKLR